MKLLLALALTALSTTVSAQSYKSTNGVELIKYPYDLNCSPKKCPDDWLKYSNAQDDWAREFIKHPPSGRGNDNPTANFNWVREKAAESPACIAVPLTAGIWDLRISNRHPKTTGKGKMVSMADTRISFIRPIGIGESIAEYNARLSQVSLMLATCTIIRSPHSKVVPVL